ncbi:MAG: hypothetical protein AB1457_02215 [Chloroflexota bacterium]
MSISSRFSLIKPTLQTPFHIDFEWWKSHDQNWRVFLLSFLCPEHQSVFEKMGEESWIDWVNPQTAEVTQVDGLQHTLMVHCAKLPGFLSQNTSLVNAVFRVFLSNGNTPLTPVELAEIIGRPADKILQTFSGTTVYQGIRPVQRG